MAKIYYDDDASLDLIKNKKIAVIGYGAQGRGQALCLRDSGLDVVVSELPETENYKKAKEDDFDPISAEEASKEADIIQILTQDDVQAAVYKKFIQQNLSDGDALVFSHGFNIHYHQIVPPENIDVFMIAPKGPGDLVREMYNEGKGSPCLVAIYQDATGDAEELALGYAKAIGGTHAGVLETSFREETETDLFGEQTVLCGGVTELIKAGFDTLVESGYQPEVAYFECLHELKLITDLLNTRGITGMRKNVSDTAEYGDLTRGKRVITEETKKAMKKILEEIQTGEFATEWILENKANRPKYNTLKEKQQEHLIEKVGKKLRGMMPWMKKE